MSDIDEIKADAIAMADTEQMPEFMAKRIRLLQERPDLMWMEDDDEETRAGKQAEFDRLLLVREPKH